MRSKFKWIFTLVLALSMQLSFAQEKTVTGVVSDATGPLPSANIVVKGTTRSVQTDLDGKYAIKVKAGETLVFSFIGMAETSVKVGASNSVNVTLKEDAVKITEVVVGVLGIRKKKDALTSSTQVVSNKELTQAANPNAVASLTGKVSGLQISKLSGGVNGTTKIVLRGTRSLTGNNEALIVIDNAISTAAVLQQLPPELIESVNVIKGSQGGALYGEQGVNGAIIVTTVKGKKDGKLTVNVSSAIDFEEVSFLPQDQKIYGQGWFGAHDPYENGGWGALLDGSIKATGLPQADGNSFQLPYSRVKDNLKDFFQMGTTKQNGFSINVGGEDSYALLSANKVATEFVVEGDKLERNSFIFKGGKKIGKFKLDGSVNYIKQRATETDSDLLGDLLQTASNIPVKMFRNSGNEGNWTIYYKNPYWTIDNNRNNSGRTYINGIASLNYEINKNININYTGNIQLTSTEANSHINDYNDIDFSVVAALGGTRSVTSQYFANQSASRVFYGDLLFNFDYMLNDNWNFKANIGQNIQERFFRVTSQGGTNLDIPGFYHITNVLSPATPSSLDNRYDSSNRASVFGNFDLAYKDYLFFNITARNDWFSVLNRGNNSVLYPSAGVSFVPTKFFSSLEGKTINYMKLSFAVSQVGNSSNVPVYTVNPSASSPIGYPFGAVNSYSFNTAGVDANLIPEVVTAYEGNLNFGFFNNRMTLDLSGYISNTTDLITSIGASRTSGIGSLLSNVGDLQTKGAEIDLGIIPIKTANFTWNTRLSYSTTKTIVTKLSDDGAPDERIQLLTNDGLGVGIYAQVGQEFPLIMGNTFNKDENGNVIIGPTGLPSRSSQLSILGKATPDYILGFTNSFEYKGLKLTAVMDYRTGHQIYSETRSNLAWSGHLYDSALFNRDTGFIYPNSVIADPSTPGAYIPNTTVYSAAGYGTGGVIDYYGQVQIAGEQNVIDATAFKLRELSLSYGIPAKLLDKTGISAFRFGVNARNLLVGLGNPFKDKKTYENRGYTDPESSFSGGNAQGYSETGQYPSTRTIGFSVNLTF
ncbi:MAG: SusC/RagA family TonB-linked outer membrane protein [Bacteroidota bacterium]